MGEQNIVVVGASFSGLLQAHSILKHVIPKLTGQYRVVLINPSPEFYFIVGSPRAITSSKAAPDDKMFFPIAEAFKEYPKDSFRFIQGSVTDVNTANRSLRYSSKAGTEELSYHALILASGSKAPSPLLTPYPSTEITRAALQSFRKFLPTARSIVIGGGGPAGVESAGEIAEFLNGSPGFLSSSPSNPKATVTIVTSSDKLLPVLSLAAATRAEKYLRRLGVNVIYKKAVVETSPPNAGQTVETLFAKEGEPKIKVTLDDGQVLEADIYIPAYPGKPTTDYLPPSLLAASHHVSTNKGTLRIDEAGPRVYAVGECSNAFRGGVMGMMQMVQVITTNLKRDLRAAEQGKEKPSTGADRTFEPDLRATQFVPIGTSKGVGQLFGWWLPSFAVWLLKGRDYFMSMARGNYVEGGAVKKESVWANE